MRKRPTQKDVAALAGVTRSVVSQVLFGGPSTIRVSTETADRVRQSAEALGYQADALARGLKKRRTAQIGILHGDGFPRIPFSGASDYIGLIMDGIIDGAFHAGYSVCLCPRLLSQTSEDAMADGRFDGLIWYSTFPVESNFRRLERCSVPIVILHSHAADFGNRYPTVICDNALGIRLALEHLSALGHRQIGFGYDSDFLFGESRLRRDAFLSEGAKMGLDISLIDVRGDQSGMREYLSKPPTHTAIIGHNEELAGDFMAGLIGQGIRVPQDMSVIGFDSTAYCDHQEPPLTSVWQPLQEMGQRAAEILVQVIDEDTPAPIETIFPCRLDVRGSTCKVGGLF